jgi:AcrR family transcriptional regulator
VLDACRELLLRDGYHATTMKDVAALAGVSVETIYKTFGGKPQLVKTVYDVTLAGENETLPMSERPETQRFLVSEDPRERIQLYARFVASMHSRLGGMLVVLAEAGSEIEEISRTTELERRQGIEGFVDRLADEGALTAELEGTRAVEACLLLTSPPPYVRLVNDYGWTSEEYSTWLAAMITATLMPAS